jgi:hypothetical protein
MISKAISALLLAVVGTANAQAPAPPPPKTGCDSPQSRELDFWLGEWDLSYTQNGQAGTSHNRITKILEGCAILEEFTGAPGTNLDGRSVSMFDATDGRWKQTWVDNQGSYLDFTGGVQDGKMILAREFERKGKRMRQRMVFEDIQRDRLKWRWQASSDEGATWSTQWEIDYRRVK